MTGKEKKTWETWSGKVVIKYVLLQIPATVLLTLVVILINQKLAIPPWLFWSIIIGSVLKDIILFPFVWRSYDSRPTHPIIGAYGVTIEQLFPEGYVRIHGQLWQARLTKGYASLESGKTVYVKDVQGIKLIVEPE